MEMHQLICDNLGMNRDTSISSLSKGDDGSTNYAFENHNIRILAVNDNTKFSVTNEKSTKYEGQLSGKFLGGCTCGRYLVLFMHDATQDASSRDFIYRLEYDGSKVKVLKLYQGNLEFSLTHPIEAIGYYESEEVQKVYWVDGLNKNRVINVTRFSSEETDDRTLEHKYFYHAYNENRTAIEVLYYKSNKNVIFADGTIMYALCHKDGTVIYYATSLMKEGRMWPSRYIDAIVNSYPNNSYFGLLNSASFSSDRYIEDVTPQYDNYSFDFQGRIESIPNVTIEKNYSKAGTFQAGVLQYFMTYYNKYGVETCLVWNSDLQYISLSDRGAKQDEAVSCGFDFKITNLEEKYDYLRIYAAYRSGINGVVSSRIVADISLANISKDSELLFTDLGNAGINFNSADIPYIGGQDIRANTLDYKQDTLFLGDIHTPDAAEDTTFNFPKRDIDITSIGGFESNVKIKEAYYEKEDENHQVHQLPLLMWVYKYVNPVPKEGLYSYTPEIRRSQKDVAGFKHRELYRFGIQFMDKDGAWTNPHWVGDKYCNLPPRVFLDSDFYDITSEEVRGNVVNDRKNYYENDALGNRVLEEYYDSTTFERVSAKDKEKYTDPAQLVQDDVRVHYTQDGCYLASIMVDVEGLNAMGFDLSNYSAYRLLVVEADTVNRRIVTQGIINPTMFNYTDRYYNRPYAMPSWIFRPRLSQITHRHFDTLPVQTELNAELQGIMERRAPGFVASVNGNYDSYMFIVATNRASVWSGFIQWKLIYYKSAGSNDSDTDRANLLQLAMFTGKVGDSTNPSSQRNLNEATDSNEIDTVASLIMQYKCALKLSSSNRPGEDVISSATVAQLTKDQIKALIAPTSGEPYVPVYVYGDNYKLISSHIYSNVSHWGIAWPSGWGDLRSTMIDKLTEDMQRTKAEDVGEELAGKIVLSPAMLPSDGLIYDMASEGSSAAEIGLAIMAALVAAAAVVISALTFGAATPIAAMATSAAIGLAVSVCAASAIGMASAAAYLDIKSITSDLAREMLALGYYPCDPSYSGSTSLGSRKERSRAIGLLLDKFFQPVKYVQNSGLAGFGWNVPVLTGEALSSNGEVDFGDTEGNVPFTTGHPYSALGRIGEDYNAFVMTGRLTALSENETDLKKKQNLFGIDESIVTLNSPDIEDIYHAVNGSENLRLDLVGMIPIDAVYGSYHMITDAGLNSNSQVLQGRFTSNPIETGASRAIGMLNGYLYQDFKPADGQFVAEDKDGNPLPIQVTENIGEYRVFMWNKKVAGFWFPGVTLKSPIDSEETIMEPKGNILNKIFANMRYSTRTLFYHAKPMTIESPVVCLDSDVTLKTFKYRTDSKTYYENIDTISVNDDNYSLVERGLNFPLPTDDNEALNRGALKDPVHIRYKETPHILLPFTPSYGNLPTLLPYTTNESPVTPTSLYKEDVLGRIKLDGIRNDVPDLGNKYIHVDVLSGKYWNKNGKLSSADVALLKQAIGTDITKLLPQLNVVSDSDFFFNSSLNLRKLFNLPLGVLLYNGQDGKYYIISYSGTEKCTTSTSVTPFPTTEIATIYQSNEVVSLPENTQIVSNGTTYYIVNGIETEGQYIGQALLTNVADITTLCSTQPTLATWVQDQLTWDAPNTPYLFVGELVKKVFDYTTWNGGMSDKSMQQLIWNVASPVTPIKESIKGTWGDTFYQRWDCEKTYPFTEEDVNSNVEVLSCMLESHKNLDGRCDTNRGIHNLINTRPSNTIFNDVYGQSDNFFTYQMLDSKFSKEHFESDVVWSLTKSNLDDIDKWTCLLASNEMSLDGRYGAVRKILNVNDVLVAFQDTGLAQIRYNETAALNTTAGLPLQMGNTGKVDGYRMISDTIGCHNKFSISKNSAGVFFADDFNKSFNQFTVNGGISDISMRANFSAWFKKNLNGHIWDAQNRDNFRTSYDEVTHDLYIVKDDVCLIYNTLLQKFTSFMDYIDTPMIARLISAGGDSETFAIRSKVEQSVHNIIEFWRMFAGASTDSIYGDQGAYGFIYGDFRGYSMEYRLNPDPFHDSIFTNYQYAADWTDPTKEVDEDNLFDSSARRYTTFDTVEAKNEYQKGTLSIQQSGNVEQGRVFGKRDVKSMFRLWRGFIPRDGDGNSNKMMKDRMRNPWIHLKFAKTVKDDSKMVFHNLIVNYYNQYGRF